MALINQLSIDNDTACALAQAAVAKGSELGVKINVAVVDASGHLLAFQRMSGAFLDSIEIAQNKAWSSASFGLATAQWSGIFAEDPGLKDGLLGRPRFSSLAGGIPLEWDGQRVGAIGVSGASEDQDVACAQAGVDTMMNLLG